MGQLLDTEPPIFVEMQGDADAPCVILINGLGMQLVEWPETLVEEMARRFFVVRLDNRDIGLSGRTPGCVDLDGPPSYTLDDMRDDVMVCAGRLSIGSFVCIGFSMGGIIAQKLSAEYPERVAALVSICSGGAAPRLEPDALRRMLRLTDPTLGSGQLISLLADDYAHFTAPQPVRPAEALDHTSRLVERGFHPDGFARQLAALVNVGDMTPELRAITAPTLIVGGKDDRCLSIDQSIDAHGAIAGSTLEIVPEMGHAVGEVAVNRILGWLDQHVPEPGVFTELSVVTSR